MLKNYIDKFGMEFFCYTTMYIIFICVAISPSSCLANSEPVSTQNVTLDALWRGRAHFEQVAKLDWQDRPGFRHEQAGSFTVRDGVWYAFNRAILDESEQDCRQDHARMVARSSTDHGRTWSAPIPIVDPGRSAKGDECAVLDGSAYYDRVSSTWHLLAQCLGRDRDGAPALWALCHYTRKAPSPLGRFESDPANPVVVGGSLWSRICAGDGKGCPVTTRDEGTPEILGSSQGRFFVTMHGYDPVSGHGFRGVVSTRDFRAWEVRGQGLPGDATLGPKDCVAWLPRCAGVGEASTVSFPGDSHRYMIIEAVTKSLACTEGQDWEFHLLRSPLSGWPRSGTSTWVKFPGKAFLTTAHASSSSVCPVQYARWIQDRGSTYLVYEDWDRKHGIVDRRLLQLVPGGAEVPVSNK
jgi:hypothetical protein